VRSRRARQSGPRRAARRSPRAARSARRGARACAARSATALGLLRPAVARNTPAHLPANALASQSVPAASRKHYCTRMRVSRRGAADSATHPPLHGLVVRARRDAEQERAKVCERLRGRPPWAARACTRAPRGATSRRSCGPSRACVEGSGTAGALVYRRLPAGELEVLLLGHGHCARCRIASAGTPDGYRDSDAHLTMRLCIA
jgi:hypothetical protein